jgi:hypothetical protein
MDVGKWSEATRPLVTIMLIGTVCYLAIMYKIDAKDFLSLATIVVLFWFKERQDQKTSEQTLSQINAIKGTGNGPTAQPPPTEPVKP